MLLEAARQLGVRLQLGPSITSGRLVLPPEQVDRAALALALNARFSELRGAATPIREELCTVDDAIELFREQDDPSACLLLEDSLESVITLLRCGETWANVTRPLLPHAGLLDDVRVLEHPLGLLLDFGARIRTTLKAAVGSVGVWHQKQSAGPGGRLGADSGTRVALRVSLRWSGKGPMPMLVQMKLAGIRQTHQDARGRSWSVVVVPTAHADNADAEFWRTLTPEQRVVAVHGCLESALKAQGKTRVPRLRRVARVVKR